MSAEDEPRGTGGLGLLLCLLLLSAAGPVFCGLLPAGPGSLLSARAAPVGAAAILILWVLVRWPLGTRTRRPGAVAARGTLLLAAGLPFMAGPALAEGVEIARIAAAAAVLAAGAAVTGVYLAGAGRRPGRDRAWLAGVILVTAVLPFVNYALNEFGGSDLALGYRISPLLLVRRILLGRPDADPRPFLLLAAGAGAVLAGGGLASRGRWGAAALLVLAGFAGDAAGAPVTARPLLGDRYVPGRALPVLVTGEGERVRIGVPGRGWVTGPARAGGMLLLVPAPEELPGIEAGDGIRETGLSPTASGEKLLVSLGPVTEGLRAAAGRRGVAVSRAEAVAEREGALPFLAADAVLDPRGVLPGKTAAALARAGVPVLRGADDAALAILARKEDVLRRTWEEPGSILSAKGLYRLFPPAPGVDRGRSRRAALVLAAFALAVFAGVRYLAGRGHGRGVTAAGVLVLSAIALVLLHGVLPGLPAVRVFVIRAREGGRRVEIRRFAARREAVARSAWDAAPLPLGAGRRWTIERRRDGRHVLRLPLGRGEERLAAAVGFGAPPGPFEPEVVLSSGGMARPGEAPRPVGAFLDTELRGPGGRPDWRNRALRKLLRLGAPRGRVAIGFAEEPGLREILLRRLD